MQVQQLLDEALLHYSTATFKISLGKKFQELISPTTTIGEIGKNFSLGEDFCFYSSSHGYY
jgi:hypothetical protein